MSYSVVDFLLNLFWGGVGWGVIVHNNNNDNIPDNNYGLGL